MEQLYCYMVPGSCLSPRSSPGSFLHTWTLEMQIPQPSQQHQRENVGAFWHPLAGFCPAPSARSSSLPGPQGPPGRQPLVPRETPTHPHSQCVPQPETTCTRPPTQEQGTDPHQTSWPHVTPSLGIPWRPQGTTGVTGAPGNCTGARCP